MQQFGILVGTLLQSRTQAHIYHWQTQGPGSFAAHLALQGYYTAIPDLVDALVESYQGRNGVYHGYKMPADLKEDGGYVKYFEALGKFVETIRTQVAQDSYIQNQIDTIVELIESTKYKLVNLQ